MKHTYYKQAILPNFLKLCDHACMHQAHVSITIKCNTLMKQQSRWLHVTQLQLDLLYHLPNNEREN